MHGILVRLVIIRDMLYVCLYLGPGSYTDIGNTMCIIHLPKLWLDPVVSSLEQCMLIYPENSWVK